jgi:hypothetical protein
MSVSRQNGDIEALIRAAELSVADRDARVRREVHQMRQRLQHDGSRWVVTGAVVGVAVLGFRALWRSKGAGNGNAVNGHARRGSGVGDRDAARQFAWVGPVALTLLRSPIVSTWLARHLWHRDETRAGASPSASASASPSDLPPTGPVLDPEPGESR